MGGYGDRPDTERRWWVDQQKADVHPLERPKAPFGQKFFRTGEGYDQVKAQLRLTDLNLKWFNDAPGPIGEWVLHHALPKERYPPGRVEKIRASIAIPAGGRGVLVDSGTSLRAIVTGEPFGERLVEVRFGEHSSFDAWVRGEWVREVVFRHVHDAMRRAPHLVHEYLETDRAGLM